MGTMTQDGPDKPVTAKANTHIYRTKNRKTEQEGPSSHPVTVTLETVPKPDRKTGKERKNNQKDNKNAQKRGTENLIRGKSVALDLNIYAKNTSETCIYTVYHTLSLSQTVNQSEANDFTFGAQNGDDRPETENGTAENGKRQASGPRKHPLRTASRIYPKEKRDTS